MANTHKLCWHYEPSHFFDDPSECSWQNREFEIADGIVTISVGNDQNILNDALRVEIDTELSN
ncbi:MAG TPA: hypothetical protein PKZ52_19495, partial [Cellvibrionaceae bacterium]|nr:hypothetical protein [Cellvibrionaceae bacterium]